LNLPRYALPQLQTSVCIDKLQRKCKQLFSFGGFFVGTVGKHRKSDIARGRILAAARRIFAAEGYQGGTIRSIATEASINPSMVIRYFGSKEGLFAAVADLDFRAAQLVHVPFAELGEGLVRHVLHLWEDPNDGAALSALMRASISSEIGRERVVAQFSAQVAALFVSIGANAMSAAPFVATQLIGLAMARYILRIPAVTALPTDEIVKRIGKTVQRYLDEANESS